MAGNERQLRLCEFPIDDVQVGPADAADANTQKHLAVAGVGRSTSVSRAEVGGV
jgi:hypothetical protein